MRIETREVLAGAYRGRSANLATLLTHSVEVDGDSDRRVLCRSVKLENIADRDSDPGGLSEPPTCTTCAARDPRFHAELRSARAP